MNLSTITYKLLNRIHLAHRHYYIQYDVGTCDTTEISHVSDMIYDAFFMLSHSLIDCDLLVALIVNPKCAPIIKTILLWKQCLPRWMFANGTCSIATRSLRTVLYEHTILASKLFTDSVIFLVLNNVDLT